MLKDKQLLFFRTDASPGIGTGHVMRCLALAQAWQDCGGSCVFIMALDAGQLFQRLIGEGVVIKRIDAQAGSVDDAELTLQILNTQGARFLVVDGYHFSPDYQQIIKKKCREDLKVLLVDDNSEQEHYFADFILNQNIYATEDFYPPSKVESYTKLLLGPRFCLLRREFLKHDGLHRSASKSTQKLLVTLGGSDPKNVTTRILQTICDNQDGKELEVKVIIGSNNLYRKDIEELAKTVANIDIVINADDIQMVDAMLWADCAVSAAGSTVWELCRLRVPCLLVIIAGNQQMVAQKALEYGIACDCFDFDNDTFEIFYRQLDRMINDQQAREHCLRKMESVDKGNGSRNVIKRLTANAIHLRDAGFENCLQIWHWNNDPFVRKMSFRTEPITLKTHEEWYQARMIDEKSFMYIGTNLLGEDIGLVRFQLHNSVADISVVIDPKFRGKGFGAVLIAEGTKRCFAKRFDVDLVRALVRLENKASLKAFLNAGYIENHRFFHEGIESVLFTRKCANHSNH